MNVFLPLTLLVLLSVVMPLNVARAQIANAVQARHAGQWELMPPWLVLQRGMTAEQVTAALGKPTQVKEGAQPSWTYANYSSGQTASVTFRNGGLFSWESPRFATAEGTGNTTWTKAEPWARLVKGMSHDQAQKVLGAATWVSISNGNQAWFYYDEKAGQSGSLTFHGNSLFSWDAAGITHAGV